MSGYLVRYVDANGRDVRVSPATPLPTTATLDAAGIATEATLQSLLAEAQSEEPVPTDPNGPRTAKGSVVQTRTATTGLGDLVTAGADTTVARDITGIVLNNSSATDSVVEVYDADGTTLRASLTAKANDMRGVTFAQALKGNAGAKWQWKTVTSVSSVVATVTYVERSLV